MRRFRGMHSLTACARICMDGPTPTNSPVTQSEDVDLYYDAEQMMCEAPHIVVRRLQLKGILASSLDDGCPLTITREAVCYTGTTPSVPQNLHYWRTSAAVHPPPVPATGGRATFLSSMKTQFKAFLANLKRH